MKFASIKKISNDRIVVRTDKDKSPVILHDSECYEDQEDWLIGSLYRAMELLTKRAAAPIAFIGSGASPYPCDNPEWLVCYTVEEGNADL
jgi:hypothetical protein